MGWGWKTPEFVQNKLLKNPYLFQDSSFQDEKKEFWTKVFLRALELSWEESITQERILEVISENDQLIGMFSLMDTRLLFCLKQMVEEKYIFSDNATPPTFKLGEKMVQFYKSYATLN